MISFVSNKNLVFLKNVRNQFFSIFFLFFLFPCVSQASVGISPGIITQETILAGTVVSEHVTLSRLNPETEAHVRVTVSGPQADAIIGASEVVIPAGEQEFIYNFMVLSSGLPSNEDLTAMIQFLFLPDEQTTSGTNIALALSAKVNFKITDNTIEKLTIQQLNFRSNKEGEIQMYYLMVNDGNVETKPSSINITVTNRETLKVAEVITIEEKDLPSIAAFSSRDYVLNLEYKLPSGNYYIEAEVVKDGGVIFHNEKSSLRILGYVTMISKFFHTNLFKILSFVIISLIGAFLVIRWNYRILK